MVSQVNGEFEAMHETTAKYAGLVRAVITRFDECHVEHIIKKPNMKANALSKFASSKDDTKFGSV